MFISRVVLDPVRLDGPRLTRIASGAYGDHQAVWRLFGDPQDRQRDFLYRRESARLQTYLIVSQRRLADPDGIWNIETKPYEPRLSQGVRLSFVLRANPVRRRRREDGRGQRHDVVMDAKRKLRAANGTETAPPMAELVQETGVRWLDERAAALGFRLEPGCVLAEAYNQHLLQKGSGRRVSFSSLDFRGLLRVADVERFTTTLFQGIGPSKAFGCGLMLVRPS